MIGRTLLLGAAVAALATPALADDATVSLQPELFMTYTNSSQISTSRVTDGSYSGVGTLVIQTVSQLSTGFASFCTGSLLASNAVVTAGHCFEDGTASDPIASVGFYLPSYGDVVDEYNAHQPYTAIGASAFKVDPNFNGDPYHGHDLAMVTLSKAATGHDVYSIYGGDSIGQAFTRVGTGTTGEFTGTDGSFDVYKRTGVNEWEFTAEQVYGAAGYGSLITAPAGSILMSDFDDGTREHDVFGRFMGDKQEGLRDSQGNLIESDSAPGDSGGPEFVNGQIAAITDFGITGGIFQGFCGYSAKHPNPVDPYSDGTSCTNSSIGELAGDTRLASYLDFIDGYLGTVPGVPEPSSWAMMLVGFGAVGAVARRRNAALRVSQAV